MPPKTRSWLRIGLWGPGRLGAGPALGHRSGSDNRRSKVKTFKRFEVPGAMMGSVALSRPVGLFWVGLALGVSAVGYGGYEGRQAKLGKMEAHEALHHLAIET